jgi:hypothetical protein
MWFKGKKTAKEKEKNYFPALPTGFLCQQLCPVALLTARTNCWQSHDV